MTRPYSLHWTMTRWVIDDQLNEFDEYSRLVETSLNERSQALADRLRQHMEEDLPPEHAEAIAESCNDEGMMLVKRFPQLLRSSLFISAYSFLEQRLLDLCLHYQGKRDDQVLLEDLADNGIAKCKTYLKKVVRADFPESSHEWQQILKYNKLRNQLVHGGPRLPQGKKGEKLRNTVVQLADVTVNARPEIELGPGFCESAVQTIRQFIAALFPHLPED